MREAKKVRILWVSRHPPLPKQLIELEKIFGKYEIVQYAGFVRDAGHIVELMKLYRADEVVTVIPMTMIYHLVNDLGIHPIFPEMEQLPMDAPPTECDYIDPGSGRKYRFKRFVRIRGFKIDKEPIKSPG